MRYVTLSEVKSTIGLTDAVDDSALTRVVEAVEELIDQHCGDFFDTRGTEGEPISRVFTPVSGYVRLRRKRMWTPLQTITKLETDTTGDGTYDDEWSSDDYRLEPADATTDDEPWRYIHSDNGLFPRRVNSVRVSGVWGWPEIPDVIAQAVVLQTGRLHKRQKDAPLGIAPLPNVDGGPGSGIRLMAKLDADVELLLRPFRRDPVLVG